MIEYKVSDYIASFLYAQGVHHVFVVIGGMITHLVDSINRAKKIQTINMHHEQSTAFAAEAIARINGVPGVALATSGPGATNLITGIGSCYYDSTPAIFITGQVNTSEQKGIRSVRQLGFQETDIVSIVRPITKGAWQISSPEDVPEIMKLAFNTALSGRPGPVLIDIPMDVQSATISTLAPTKITLNYEKENISADIDELIKDITKAQRPLILAGGGIQSARGLMPFRTFVDKMKVPVVNSLMMVDALPYNHLCRVGMIGTYGNRWANIAISKSDLILVLGSRLDIRQTGSDTKAFKSSRKIYHVDCDINEINNRVQGCRPIISHLLQFFQEINIKLSDEKISGHKAWMVEISNLRNRWKDTSELTGITSINPNVFIHLLSSLSINSIGYVVDVGNHQMWSAQSVELYNNQKFITSGGMGAMGFALPAGIGVAFANPGQPVIVIAGDGGFQINIQELETIKRYNLPIKIVVLNNENYGMVRQFQQNYFNGRYYSTYWDYSAPDFTKISRSYGIKSVTIDKTRDIKNAIKELWKNPQSPFLLQVMIDPFTNAYPKIAFGRPNSEMEPLSKPLALG